MTRCATCNNTARLGMLFCTPCADRNFDEEQRRDLMENVRTAAMDLHDEPVRRFADAVIAWMEERA